jgi:lipoprotein-releasing system ATP-binding protein
MTAISAAGAADTALPLQVDSVTRVLPGPVPVTLVADISLEIPSGQFVAIVGPSGSGKSSLLYLLGLLDRPTAGRILINGLDAANLSRDAAPRVRLAQIGFVFQFHFLLPEFSALDNILLPMRRLARLPAAAMTECALALLERLGLADKAGRRPDQLSGGERQRVAIARALANDPPILLADEPTGNLDTQNADHVFALLAALARDDGRTVVAVTHNLDLAARADRIIGMRDGRIVADRRP